MDPQRLDPYETETDRRNREEIDRLLRELRRKQLQELTELLDEQSHPTDERDP